MYEVGDRVMRVRESRYIQKGAVGTVIGIDPGVREILHVKFDKPIKNGRLEYWVLDCFMTTSKYFGYNESELE